MRKHTVASIPIELLASILINYNLDQEKDFTIELYEYDPIKTGEGKCSIVPTDDDERP